MRQRPAGIIKTVPAELIAQAVGLSVADLDLNGWDINMVKTEVAHLMVPVKNSALLKKAIGHE